MRFPKPRKVSDASESATRIPFDLHDVQVRSDTRKFGALPIVDSFRSERISTMFLKTRMRENEAHPGKVLRVASLAYILPFFKSFLHVIYGLSLKRPDAPQFLFPQIHVRHITMKTLNEDDVLRLMESGPVTIEGVARALSISWTKAQAILFKLVGQGKITYERKGRMSIYRRSALRCNDIVSPVEGRLPTCRKTASRLFVIGKKCTILLLLWRLLQPSPLRKGTLSSFLCELMRHAVCALNH